VVRDFVKKFAGGKKWAKDLPSEPEENNLSKWKDFHEEHVGVALYPSPAAQPISGFCQSGP